MDALTKAELEPLTGNRRGPYNSHNPVSQVQIWQWCSAMGDRNPLYLDREYQASVGIERAVAPPTMMQMWTMRDVNMEYAPGSTDAAPYQVFDTMAQKGFPDNVAVSYDISFHRYLSEGERPHHYTTVVNISELKETSLGRGYFVTERVEYLDDQKSCFAEALITYFQYQAKASSTDTAHDAPLHAPEAAESKKLATNFAKLDSAGVKEGQALPELTIPITHKLIVSGAIASQDFIDVHHNLPSARAAAMPDIFMNILTTCGLCGRYLSDWAGPSSRLKKLTFRLLAPNVPGDTMVMQGQVCAVNEQQVSVDFAGKNSRGFHVTGSATLSL